MTMADTVAVMNKGKIEQMGAPQELYELPHTAFVAKFLGQSNLFTGSVTSSGAASLVVDARGSAIEVPTDRAQRTSGTITVGVRPEKVTLATTAPKRAAGTNVVGPGRITDVSFSGVSTQYEVTLPQHGVVNVFVQNTSISQMHRDGDEVWLSWSVEHTFGLVDEAEPEQASRFHADDSTTSIAVHRRQQLEAELEEG